MVRSSGETRVRRDTSIYWSRKTYRVKPFRYRKVYPWALWIPISKHNTVTNNQMLSLVHNFKNLKNKILVFSVWNYFIISLTWVFFWNSKFWHFSILSHYPYLAPIAFYFSSHYKLHCILVFLHLPHSALNFSNTSYNTMLFDACLCFCLFTQNTYFIILSLSKWSMNPLDP